MPSALKSKNGEGSGKYYSIYNIIAQLMYMNQQLDQILELDVFEALLYIKYYSKISNPKPKKKNPVN